MKRLVPRASERTRIIGEAQVQPLGSEPLRAQVINWGQSGLAFFSDHGWSSGQVVKVSFDVRLAAGDIGCFERDGRIVRSRSLPDGNIVGLAFLRPLETAEWKLLEQSWVRS